MGGAVADRVPKRRLLLVTQIALGGLALGLLLSVLAFAALAAITVASSGVLATRAGVWRVVPVSRGGTEKNAEAMLTRAVMPLSRS